MAHSARCSRYTLRHHWTVRTGPRRRAARARRREDVLLEDAAVGPGARHGGQVDPAVTREDAHLQTEGGGRGAFLAFLTYGATGSISILQTIGEATHKKTLAEE